MNKNILKKAISKYGTHNQMLKCIEECGELSRAISRILTELSSGDGFTTKESEDNLYEEMGDVYVTLAEMILIFNCEEKVKRQIEFKINRLKERLEHE